MQFNDRQLGREISRAERAHDESRGLNEPLWTLLPTTSHIIGITGPPGAGKSTLTDGLITHARRAGLKTGVLAIDPSSPFTGGAVLGDRIRMSRHSADPGVFIRSMGSRTSLGGVAGATRSAVRLLADNAVDVVILETVGVGQAELDIMHVADTVVVVVVPGLGDTVQMSKAGIMEIGDIFVVNQADRIEANKTRRDLEQALSLGEIAKRRPIVTMTTATTGDGLEGLWDHLRRHFEYLVQSGKLAERRQRGQRQEISDEVSKMISVNLRDWMQSAAFDALLKNKEQSDWSVDDLTANAVDQFLSEFGPKQ